MNHLKDKKGRNNKNKESFITIDDLAQMAKELLDGIIQISSYKHPLSVRKGDSLPGHHRKPSEERQQRVTAQHDLHFSRGCSHLQGSVR